jgi:acetyltransferase-like isoleucine patch superfamily enzyme
METADLIDYRDQVPSWWSERGNVLLGVDGLQVPEIIAHPGVEPPTNARIVIHSMISNIGTIILWGDRPSVFIGDAVDLPQSTLSCCHGASIVIEGALSASIHAWIDARNGGSIRVGREGLWSSQVRIMTDDMHAIRHKTTGERLNKRGSTVTIGRHVWLGMQAVVMPGATIGDDVVVGIRSVVSGEIASNVAVAGVPARVIREDVTWTYEDAD